MTQVLDILDRLVACASVTAGPNKDISDYIRDFLAARGAKVTRIAGPSNDRFGLVATLGPENAGGVVLSGHTDVVPVTGQRWTRRPFALSREGDKLYGRGTTDMKGFLACMLYAADAASKNTLRAPLKLVFSYDEEIGCVGIQHMAPALPAALGAPRACIVGEPTEMTVATGHKGKIAFKATCLGQAGHSALAPRFVNAIHLAADFVLALRTLQADLKRTGIQDPAFAIPYSTVHVGEIHGGQALNIVPEEAHLTFELRHLAEDTPEHLLERIEAAAHQIARAHPQGRINLEKRAAYPALDVPQDSDIVTFCQSLVETNACGKVAFGTEAGVFQALGIPTIVCGPGSMEDQGHKADEYITLFELQTCTRMMDRLVETLCAPAG